MEKDIKYKNIVTNYCGKAFQVEADDIRLHGNVDITGSLTVNGSPLDTPTASGTSYDNTNSGLGASNVQGAIDEIAFVAKPWVSLANVTSGTGTIPNFSDYTEFLLVFHRPSSPRDFVEEMYIINKSITNIGYTFVGHYNDSGSIKSSSIRIENSTYTYNDGGYSGTLEVMIYGR